ncbi:MAG: phospholipid scramblase-related protein [Planctomycetota bacterium]
MLDKKMYFIKERVGFVKLTDTYDILDPESKQPLGVAKEEIGAFFKLLRLIINKTLLPTTVNVYETNQTQPVLSIRKGGLFTSKVSVMDKNGTKIGYFKAKLFAIGGGFWVYNTQGQQVAEIKGDWKGWNFKFLGPNNTELGTVTKKWAGIGKELFTSADNYIISINDTVKEQSLTNTLLLAAGLAIDIVYKEKS